MALRVLFAHSIGRRGFLHYLIDTISTQKKPLGDKMGLSCFCCGTDGGITGSLLWKNGIIKKRRWKSSCCEIFVPVFFLLLVTSLKSLTTVIDVPTGWSRDQISNCFTTGKAATSTFILISCPLPYEHFLREQAAIEEIFAFVAGKNAKIFLVDNDKPRERQVCHFEVIWCWKLTS